MKNIFKNKKLIAIIGVIIVILAIVITCIILNTNKKEEAPIHKEETHSMFVKINPLVKLVFKYEYDICKDSAGREYICGDEINNVIDYELINDDAKNFYKDLDFKNKDLYDALLMLCETAVDNDIVFENLEITTDSDSIKVEQITDYLQEKSKYEITYTVNVNFEEHIDEDKIIEAEETENERYLVTFDSDGGSKVESQTITKGNKALIPTSPTKEGYKFIEWQLNDKYFDFNTEITADITLKAKWEKENTGNEQTTKPNQNESNNQTTKPNENKNNNNSQNTENNKSENSASKIYTVTFDSDGGTPVESQKVKDGELLIKPTDPTKKGWEFLDWRLDDKIFFFNRMTVTKNITLKAKWVKQTTLSIGQFYSLERIKFLEYNYDITIKLIPDAKCGYLEGGNEQPIVAGKTYIVHVHSLDPYSEGGCGDSQES